MMPGVLIIGLLIAVGLTGRGLLAAIKGKTKASRVTGALVALLVVVFCWTWLYGGKLVTVNRIEANQ
jgi:hypothetical protein